MDSRTSQLKQQTDLASRKRKVVERSVVRVKIGENCRKVKNEGPPSDSWSWRKYGQKPIKGSPFPRGYYRCSTSKGCSAKKQVERCRTDASVLVITYTSTHNHPTHDHHSSKQNHDHKSPKQKDTDEEEEEEEEEEDDDEEEEEEEIIKKEDQDEAIRSEASTSNELREEQYFQYIESPLRDMMMNQDQMMTISTSLEFVLDEKPINMISCCSLEIRSPKSEEGNDFFDELEELPAALPLITSFTRSNYCFQETIPPLQS